MKQEKKLTNHIADVVAKKSEAQKEEIYIDNLHEYNYIKDDSDNDVTIYTLLYSDSEQWSDHIQGKVALTLIDDGNGVVIKQLNLEENIEYLQLHQLHILLRLIDEDSVYEISKPAVRTIF